MSVTWPAARISIGSMQRAKGPGFVALEISAPKGSPVAVLHSDSYSEPLLSWLVLHRAALSSIFGCAVEIENWGSDY